MCEQFIKGYSMFKEGTVLTLAKQMGADPGAAEPPVFDRRLLTKPTKRLEKFQLSYGLSSWRIVTLKHPRLKIST